MKTPQKHAALIKAWADGVEIEVLSRIEQGWVNKSDISPWLDQLKYRIKPKPRPDVIEYRTIASGLGTPTTIDNLKLTFSGETGALIKAEVI